MRRSLVLMMLLASAAAAQTPRKKACDFLSTTDVEGVIGEPHLVSVEAPIKNGAMCSFQKVVPGRANQNMLVLMVTYTDAPDRDAVVKWLKGIETTTYDHAQPMQGVGDAAYYTQPFGKGLEVFVGGSMMLNLGPGTPDQLRTLAERALGNNSRTGFAYAGSVPPAAKPASPPIRTASSGSELDRLKSQLSKKAGDGDVHAAEALAGLSRYPTGNMKPDYATALYWYRRSSDHGAARSSYELGMMYKDGLGTAANIDAAKELFTKAADAGYVPAMMPLAFIYAANADFISKRRAAEWALKAAEGNDPEGHLTAGYLWDKGLLSFDDAESGRNALAEYRKASGQGNCVAMMNIGGLYFNGSHGLKQDAAQAEQWFGRADSCFGKGVQDMQQTAARYRGLAAAGHLPVPDAPPPPRTGSHFFNRPGSRDQQMTDLVNIVGDMLSLAALSAAYLVEHPEMLKDVDVTRGSTTSSADYAEQSDRAFRSAQVYNKVFSGNCRPPVGCGAF